MKTYLYRASNLKFRVGTYCCTHQYKLPVKFSTKLTQEALIKIYLCRTSNLKSTIIFLAFVL